jgi:hypothetical protein
MSNRFTQSQNPELRQALRAALQGQGQNPAQAHAAVHPQISIQELEMQEGILTDYIRQADVSLKTLAQVCERNAEVIAALAKEKEDGRTVSGHLLDAMSAYVHSCSIREDLAMQTTRRQLAQFETQLSQIRQQKLAMGVVG